MPIYEFQKDSDGEVVELFLSFAEYDSRVRDGVIKLDDGQTARVFWNSKSGISTYCANYPMTSSAAGVHPDQIKEHMDHLRAKGCGQVNHTKDGDVIFESRGQRKKVLEALGMFDRAGGFGDAQAKHVTRIKSFR